MPAPATAEIERLPQATAPAMVDVPFTASVNVPGIEIEPSSQCFSAPPFSATWPVAEAGA